MKTFSHLWQYVAELILEWEMFQTRVVQKLKTHILCSTTVSRKSCCLLDTAEKSRGAREAADNKTHAPTYPRTYGPTLDHTHTHTHTQRICNIYCFSTATMVLWTRLNVRSLLLLDCIYLSVSNAYDFTIEFHTNAFLSASNTYLTLSVISYVNIIFIF